MTNWATDLESCSCVHRGCSSNLQLDGSLIRITLDEVLETPASYLGVVNKLALVLVARLLAVRLGSITNTLRLVNQLTQGQELLTANLAIPHSSTTPPRTLENI